MEINLKCGKCKNYTKTTPFVYSHNIIINHEPVEMKNYFFASVKIKTVCAHCGDTIYSTINKIISNQDIERLCYGEKEKHN